MRICMFTIATVVLALCSVAPAEEITVAAASDLQFALKDVAARFESATGNKVRLVFGSSGNFFAEIANGAPFDVFLSADSEYPRKLIEAGKADKASLVVYGIGRIVLSVPRDSRLDINQGLKLLTDPAVHKIALANPQHAPYGRAAVAALRRAGLYDQLSGKFVLGENISQTMQFVDSGNADAGFVALSLAAAPAARQKGRYWLIPLDFYPPIEQAAVVISSSTKKNIADAFLRFLQTPDIEQVMKGYGFERPEGKK